MTAALNPVTAVPAPSVPPSAPQLGRLARRDAGVRGGRAVALWSSLLLDVYVCGPDEWTEHVHRTTQAAGLPPEQFHVETFKW